MDIDRNHQILLSNELRDLILDFIAENASSAKEASVVIPLAAAEAEATILVDAASEAGFPPPNEFPEVAAQAFKEHVLQVYALLSHEGGEGGFDA